MKIAVVGATGTVGRHVVQRAAGNGHEVVALSRSRGINVLDADALAHALTGVDVVIDVMNPPAQELAQAAAFFSEAVRTLHRVGAARNVQHLVTLSIVGIDSAPFGYFAAKLAQERAVMAGPIPSTVLRATQFHEFPAQLVSGARDGSEAPVLDLRVQTVAARTVADVLVEVAEGAPQGRAQDLAGPEKADLVALARRFVEHRGLSIRVRPDAEAVAGMPPEALIPGDKARIAGPTFEEWLSSEDAPTLSR